MTVSEYMLEYLPLALVTGSGFIAWGEMRARQHDLRRDIELKVSKDEFRQVGTRLERIEAQLDRLLER